MSDRGPSAWQVERSVAAWQRAQYAMRNDQHLATDEQPIQAALDADPSTLPIPELLARLVRALNFCTARTEEAQGLMDEMQARRDRYRQRALTLRTEIFDVMQSTERSSVSTPFGTASIVAGRATAVVMDPQLVPDSLCTIKTTRTPNQTAITAKLSAGEDVPGAVLSNPAPFLRVATERTNKRQDIADSNPEES